MQNKRKLIDILLEHQFEVHATVFVPEDNKEHDDLHPSVINHGIVSGKKVGSNYNPTAWSLVVLILVGLWER